ncbi:MAG: hypothetical protein IPK82_44140 [Polyangiaceae bacterium]|nr:hypothetical protein [Polyangiaceae bacterium]
MSGILVVGVGACSPPKVVDPDVATGVTTAIPVEARDAKAVDPVWTEKPRLENVPKGPLRGGFETRRFKLATVKFHVSADGIGSFLAKSGDGTVEVEIPIRFKPEEQLCVERSMGDTIDGRIVVESPGGRRFSNRYAFVLKIDRAELRPYPRGVEPSLEGFRLGAVSGKILVMFAEGKYGAGGPAWVGGHFDNVPVYQHGDRGEEESCAKGPHQGGLGTSRAFRSDVAPRVMSLKPGPMTGKIGKVPFDVRGAVLFPRLAGDTRTGGWTLLFSSTSLKSDGMPQALENVPGKGLVTHRGVRVELQTEPVAGSCIERTADFAFSGPTPELEPPHIQLRVTAYVPPSVDVPGKMSGAAVLDWMEGSVVAGTFTDIPVQHPDSHAMKLTEPVIRPEKCGL